MRSLTVKSSTYKRMIFGNLSGVLAGAVDDDLLAKNPCRAGSVRTPKLEPQRVVPWTVDRVVAVRDALPDEYAIVTTIAAGLGLRQGEVFGLAVDDVDFLRGTVTVRRQVRLFRDGRQTYRLPKGRKDRTVPLAASVRDALAAHLAAYPARPVTLPDETVNGRPVTVSLIVSTPDDALHRNVFNRRVWAPALRAASVPAGSENRMHAG